VQRFKHVLLPLDEARCDADSLRSVTDLVRRNGARLTLLSTVEEPSRLRQFWSTDDVDEAVAAAETELTAQLASIAASADVPTEWSVARGGLAVAAIRRVVRGDADLVVTIDSDTPPAPETRRLLRKCPCPVWVVRPEALPTRGLCVLAAVNPTSDEVDLNTMILELASSMVERAGGVLHVVHAWEMIGSTSKKGRTVSGRFNLSFDELVTEARGRRATALDGLLAGLRDYPIERHVHLVHGPAESTISELVDSLPADVLVMGTVARGGLSGLMIGNTAERVLTEAPCSLMAVKPADFVSPIRAD